MKNFLKRNGIVIMLILIFLVYFFVNMMDSMEKIKELEKVEQVKLQEIEELNEKIKQLNEELDYAVTPEAIEDVAREKLKMVKPNEIIYIIRGTE